MEVPVELTHLYNHWEVHSSQKVFNNNIKLQGHLLWFIAERMRIWEKKYKGDRPPFTTDLILQRYRFCNIYRELDRQTIEIHTQLKHLYTDFSVWLLNLAFHRFVCNPKTVECVGLLSFDEHKNVQVYDNLLALPRPIYGTPYVFPVSVIQNSEYSTREKFFCFYLPKVMLSIAHEIQTFNSISVNVALARILPLFGFNFKFHWTEMLIDIAYQYLGKVNLYTDFYIGPGAIPTAKAINPNLIPTKVVDLCVGTDLNDFPYLTFNDKPILLSAETWEGIFCEYRKYTNLKNGHGRVRNFV